MHTHQLKRNDACARIVRVLKSSPHPLTKTAPAAMTGEVRRTAAVMAFAVGINVGVIR